MQKDFPILRKPLIYFDNAATSQKPRVVIEAIASYYENSNANVHRGIHDLAETATALYEGAREKAANFVGAKSPKEIIFVRNTTEALNLVAYSLADFVKPGDKIVATVAEHHSNYLPWERLAKEKKAKFVVTKPGQPLSTGKIIAINHASNVLGTINENEILSLRSRMTNKYLVVDGAQYVPHHQVNVQDLGCDFYAFSAHKMFGPMGIGVLWGKQELLEKMPPYMLGGGMITMELPDKFEAGTPNVAGAVGLAAAIEYINKIGWKGIEEQEKKLTKKFIGGIRGIRGIKLYGPEENRVPTFSFSLEGIHPHDAAQFLNDKYHIAVRAGQHCAGPLHEYLGVPATLRASLAFYNTEEEVEIFIKALKDLIKTFSK